MQQATFRVWRGEGTTGAFRDYTTEIVPGMVVLDAIHRIQASQATDLACRWNCKAGKCGSCSAEINGKPRLMCITITENAIIPLKERVVDRFYDPVRRLLRVFSS